MKHLNIISAIIIALVTAGLIACEKTTDTPDTGIDTKEISDIGCNSATSGGIIDEAKLPEVTECGIVWSMSADPSITDNGMIGYDLNTSTGEFTCMMYGLLIEKEYHARAYYMIGSAIYYGNDLTFTTSSCQPFTYGGTTYQVVQIGNQCWMAENLKVGTHTNSSVAMSNNGTTERYAYDNDQNNYTQLGALYHWQELMDYNLTGSSSNPSGITGISPPGWHIPSDTEWQQLEMFLGMSQADATSTGWRGSVANHLKPGGSTGFNVQFGGFLTTSGLFADGNCFGYFWTATGVGYTDAYYRAFDISASTIRRDLGGHLHGMSVRCVKN